MATSFDALTGLSLDLVVSEQHLLTTLATYQATFENVLRGKDAVTDFVLVTADYTATSANSVIFVDASAGVVTVQLPLVAEGINIPAGTTKPITIKKLDSSINAVRVLPQAGETIDGLALYSIADANAAISLMSDGTDWNIMGDNFGATGTSPPVNHSALLNLNADDHTQYLLVAGTRAMTGNLNMGTRNITNVGTVDGRDVSVDGAKLDTLPSAALAANGTYNLSVNSGVASLSTALVGPGTVTADTLAQYSGTTGNLLKQGPALGTSVGNIPVLVDVGGNPGFAALSAANLTHVPYPVYPATVDVFTEADFPAPVAGVITLAVNTTYVLRGAVTLTPGNRIVMPPATSIRGSLTTSDSLSGNYAGSLITVTGAGSGNTFFLRCTISNTSTNAAAVTVEVNAASGTVIFDASRVNSNYVAVKVQTSSNFGTIGSTFVAGTYGIQFIGATSATKIDSSSVVVTAANGVCISFGATSVVPIITLLLTGVVTTLANQFGVVFTPGASTMDAFVQRLVFFGPGTLNSGWDQTNMYWHVMDTPGLEDSTYGGGSSLTGTPTLTVTITTQSAWVPVSQTSVNAYVLDSGSERFSLVSQETGEIQFAGKPGEKIKVFIQGSVSVSKLSGGGSAICELGVYYNDALLTSTVTTIDTSNGVFRNLTTQGVLQSFTTGDRVRLAIRNTTNTDDFVVSSGGISAFRLG